MPENIIFPPTTVVTGASRLGINKRWGNFWSVSGAWRISSENFMQGLPWINDLKLRVSYGINGTLPSKLYSHLSLMSTGYDYQDKPGIAPGTIPNPDLAWERNKNLNVGFDTRLFERLSFSFDYYNRLTTDLLQDVPTSMTVGFTSALKNVGSMINRGVEIDISYDIFKHSAIQWTTGLALSHNKNFSR
ncbi:TonB-dependent receptor [Phocaeicola sp.]|uniref:TonB-dependent receptor domain-containing protein n=1 Tax=Phocaeicola sp. TaxID=2773926 RepID=UPI00300EA7AA